MRDNVRGMCDSWTRTRTTTGHTIQDASTHTQSLPACCYVTALHSRVRLRLRPDTFSPGQQSHADNAMTAFSSCTRKVESMEPLNHSFRLPKVELGTKILQAKAIPSIMWDFLCEASAWKVTRKCLPLKSLENLMLF